MTDFLCLCKEFMGENDAAIQNRPEGKLKLEKQGRFKGKLYSNRGFI